MSNIKKGEEIKEVRKNIESLSLINRAELLSKIAIAYEGLGDLEAVVDTLQEMKQIMEEDACRKNVKIRILLKKTADKTGYKIMTINKN